ncbi:putative phosphoribosyl transferase [Rubripirellula tenax]|uniref:Putative phosphoribosyl transferase n=1 Tax=Rubripirellula tenax TaxID=2528015 RepID=A0A5C6EQM0_9BACT|nr:dienelactone hydrolase family protein [Rubripirellula tenax]TWU50580.1 putative phosphoribosyl transferase [Rubripirellula tenax]
MNHLASSKLTSHRIGPRRLKAVLTVPEHSAESLVTGLVVFAHGSDSSCVSPRNEHIANRLRQSGMATLLFDFLTESESSERDNSFKPSLLAERLGEAITWAQQQPELQALPLGLFGSGTGMSAVIVYAADHPTTVQTIVGRGGRTDLASPWLTHVTAPALFIVGDSDRSVLSANQAACRSVAGTSRLEVIAGASHLFSETGKLDEVAELAADWFAKRLTQAATEPATD